MPVNQLLDFIQHYPRLLIISGAGISLASGIPTYRDVAGVWQGSAPMQHQDFVQHHHVRQRYWARSFLGRSTIADAEPNASHFALAKLESAGFIELLITQNVDNLHQRAGSQNVIDLHGNLRDIHCLSCAAKSSRNVMQQRLAEANPHLVGAKAQMRPDGDAIIDERYIEQVECPACEQCGGVLMPDVVFFGGRVPAERVEACLQALQQADALLAVGSSLKVYSGFRFCLRAKEWGKPIALINPGMTRADELAELHIKADCSDVLSGVVQRLAV